MVQDIFNIECNDNKEATTIRLVVEHFGGKVTTVTGYYDKVLVLGELTRDKWEEAQGLIDYLL